MCFLIYKAVATPRAAQTPMLAILFKDGIVYYSVTFAALLWATLMWRAASYVYLGIPLYSTWMFLQVAMSRLLLSIKSTQAVYLHKSSHPNARLPQPDVENANDSTQEVTVQTIKPSKVKFAPNISEKSRPSHQPRPSQSSHGTNRTLSPTQQLASFFEMTKPKGWRRSRSASGSGSSDPNYIPYRHPYGHRDSSASSTHSTGSTDWFWWVGAGSRRPQTPTDVARTSFGDDIGADPYDYMRGTQSKAHHRYESWL